MLTLLESMSLQAFRAARADKKQASSNDFRADGGPEAILQPETRDPKPKTRLPKPSCHPSSTQDVKNFPLLL